MISSRIISNTWKVTFDKSSMYLCSRTTSIEINWQPCAFLYSFFWENKQQITNVLTNIIENNRDNSRPWTYLPFFLMSTDANLSFNLLFENIYFSDFNLHPSHNAKERKISVMNTNYENVTSFCHHLVWMLAFFSCVAIKDISDSNQNNDDAFCEKSIV